MAVVKCINGHFYNDSESATCPYCSGDGSAGKTIPLGNTVAITDVPGGSSVGQTVMLDDVNTVSVGGVDIPQTKPVSDPVYGRTMIIDEQKNSEVKPVRGWLVVVDGEKRGLDFRVHTGSNYVGRSSKNDICFDFDQTISKEKCCDIKYDDRTKQFYILLGEGANNIYINNRILLQPTELKDFDIVEIGQTKLVFRSLCNDSFDYPAKTEGAC
ncbi:MAG: FHA domain-containing protein [Clostridia bacterium]|nr:FHA domain-containing protein [Clostridia bacterium]